VLGKAPCHAETRLGVSCRLHICANASVGSFALSAVAYSAHVGVGLANWWIIILVPVALAIVHATAVRHEEVYLERKFEDEFTRYKASVRRWL
jgi:protein-S-isoprenylcysteine O-methyltransferase Ste14